jgi:hypothetical protein
MVKNKLRCAYRHCNGAIIDTVRAWLKPSIVSKSAPVRGNFGQIDGAHIDTPSRVCHRQGFLLVLILGEKGGGNRFWPPAAST